jgi:hypothetical protein
MRERKIVKMKLVMEEVYVSIQEAAEMNNISPCTISNRVKNKTIVNNEMFFHHEENDEDEIWVDHPSLPIQLSDYGRVRYMNGRTAVLAGNRYQKVTSNKKCYMVHRLVAETFLENPLNPEYVHHIDHNKQNNRVSNLMWVTHKQNVRYYFEYAKNKKK